MGVPTRRAALSAESADRPAGPRGSARVASRTLLSARAEPPVESRRLQGSQIGLAKGAVWSEGAAAAAPKERVRKREREGQAAGGCY